MAAGAAEAAGEAEVRCRHAPLSLCDLSCICGASLMRHKPCKLAECGRGQANKLACVIKGGAAARGRVLLP